MFKRLILSIFLVQLVLGLAMAESLPTNESWYPQGLPPHLSKAQSQEVNKRIQNYLKRNFYRIIDNNGNIEVASEEFGIDNLVVAKVVFGIQRQVEKNPWPQGDHDQFLLKDAITIGFRLGAGLVVFGDIAYIKQYTLVQPVATHREGMLQNKFIVNLMLPFEVRREDLPEKYVLMTESFLEGRGRLKLGGGVMMTPFVHQTHHSRVDLTRTYIDNRRPDIMRVFIDHGKAREWGQIFYINFLEILSYTFLKGAVKNGENQRRYYEVPKNLPEYQKMLHNLSVNNDTSLLEQFALERRVEDRFRESFFKLNLLGLYHKSTLNRYDEINEYIADSDDEWTLTNQQYQQENERETGWSSVISGEDFYSNILFMAYNEEGKLGRPHIVITTRINDKRARPKEVYDRYLDSLNRIALRSRTLELAPESRQLIKDKRVRATMDMRITIDDKAVEELMAVDEISFWEHIEKVTGTESKRWQEALAPQFNLVERPDILRPAARRLKRMSRRLYEMRHCPDNPCRIKELTKLVREGIYVRQGRFAPDMLAIFHSFVEGHIGIEASMSLVHDDKIIDTALWDNGVAIEVPQKYYRFNFRHATEIYHLFSEGA